MFVISMVLYCRVTTLPQQHPPYIPCSSVETVAGISEEVGVQGSRRPVCCQGTRHGDGQQSSRGAPLAENS